MRAITFSIDLLVGLTVTFFLLILFSIKVNFNLEQISLFENNILSNDILEILSNVKAKEFFNFSSTLKNLYTNGTLKEEDVNQPILELIGSLWYSNNKTIASNITKEVLEIFLTGKCYSLDTENETIYNNCQIGESKVVSFKLTSGYQIGKPVLGYIARAWATKFVKNTTLIIPIYPEGSGWTGQKLEVSKKFKLPSNITILNATLYLSVHFGTSVSNILAGAGFQNLKINGVEKKNNINWLYLEQEDSGGEITTAAYGYLDVTNLLSTNNEIYIAINTPSYHSHLHPGSRLIVTYNITEEASIGKNFFSKRYYFDNVIGRKGSWSMLSFHIPKEAKNVSAILNLNLRDVEDTYVSSYNTTDIIIYINSNQPFFMDSNGTGSSLCIRKTGYFCDRSIASTFNFYKVFNITNYLVNGTNVVSVYVNCCDTRNNLYDYEWGRLSSQIYSDPINDPQNSSFVEINYTLEKPFFEYGEVDLTKELLFGGGISNPKNFTYNITQRQSKIVEAFTHIAQGFSYMINVTQKNPNGTIYKIFTSPSGRVVPESVFVFPETIGVGNNTITIRDFQPNFATSPFNKILPWSSFEYTYLVKALVGYGNVFNSSQLAIEDAIQRLKNLMGGEGIDVQNIQTDSQAIGDIKWIWGPALFKLVIWQ